MRPPTSTPTKTRRLGPVLAVDRLVQREAWLMVGPRTRLAITAYGANDRRVNGDLRTLPTKGAVGHHLDPAPIGRWHIQVEVTQCDMDGGSGAACSRGLLSWPAHQLARMRSGGPRRRPSRHHKSSAAGQAGGVTEVCGAA